MQSCQSRTKPATVNAKVGYELTGTTGRNFQCYLNWIHEKDVTPITTCNCANSMVCLSAICASNLVISSFTSFFFFVLPFVADFLSAWILAVITNREEKKNRTKAIKQRRATIICALKTNLEGPFSLCDDGPTTPLLQSRRPLLHWQPLLQLQHSLPCCFVLFQKVN